MAIKYLNFDLLVERSGKGYQAKVLESPAGESSEYFEVPFSQREVEDFFIQIGHTRSTESPEAKQIHSFGQQLFEATFNGKVRDCLRASLNETTKQGAGLRVRLRLADLPELGNLPWEFMYDPSQSRFLALSVETPLVRYLETAQQIQPLTVQPPLRILTMICSPRDYPKLDTEKEWENLQEALRDLQGRGLVDLQRLDPPTLPALQRQLRREQYHIFHFIGHGVFSKANQDGYLLLETEQRQGHRLSGRDLGTILHDHRPLRLAMLNACEGARSSLEDQFSGTAQSLMQQGIPAVIAMQFRITDQASITLAHEFYGALADGYPVDAALTEARKAIKTQGNNLEWGTPVLYMRSPDGQVFDVAQLPTSAPFRQQTRFNEQETERLEKMYTEALEAYYLGRWDEAFQKFQAIVDLAPDHKDAAAKLESARHKARMQGLQNQASTAEKAADWDKAIEVLERIAKEDASLTEIPARLAQARRQKRLHELYTEAQRLSQAEKWQAVLEIFKEIEAIVPRHPDPQGLRVQAEKRLAQSRRIAELESAYADGLRAIDQSRWQEAVRHLRRVRGMQAGYRETDQLIKRAEAELVQARTTKKGAAAVTKSPDLAALSLAGFGLFFAARFAIELFGPLFDRIRNSYMEGIYTAQAIYMLILGLLLGSVICWWLRIAKVRLSGKHIALIVFGTSVSTAVTLVFALFLYLRLDALNYANLNWIWNVMFSLLGAWVGWMMAAAIRAQNPQFGARPIIFTIVGWSLAFLIGQYVQGASYGSLQNLMGERFAKLIAYSLETGIAGLFGTLITFAQLKGTPWTRSIWLTAAGAAAGMALGNYFVYVYIISGGTYSFASRTFTHTIWGVLIGLGFSLPSKDYKRLLTFSLLGGLGMYAATLGWRFVPTALYGLFLGAILGFTLGLGTRRISITLAFSALFGSVITILNGITPKILYNYIMLSPTEILFYPLFAAVFGFVLGLAWSYLQVDAGQNPNLKSSETEIQV